MKPDVGLASSITQLEGEEAAASGDYVQAEALLWRALQSDPSRAACLAALVDFLVERNRLDEAQAVVEQYEAGMDPEGIQWRDLIRVDI